MSDYRFNKAEYGTHKLILSWLGENNLVLDVGCGRGYLGAYSRKNRFWGIEKNRKEAEKAQKRYEKVIVGDVERLTNSQLPGKKFDVIIFADVLEHLVYPQETLKRFVANLLKKDGKVIISLPNVAHLSIRLNLLLGRFGYQEKGILDKTHFHLYTLRSAQALIESSGLKTEEIKFSSNRLGVLINKIPLLGTILGFNLIFLCFKK